MPPERTECSERTGWYEEQTITHLRRAVKNAMRQLAGTAIAPRKRKRGRLVPAAGSRAEAASQHGTDDDELGHDAFEEEKGVQLTSAGTAHLTEGQRDAWRAPDQHGLRGTYEDANASLRLGERSGSSSALEADQGSIAGIKVRPPP